MQNQAKMYLAAIFVPVIATFAAIYVESVMPRGNISLVYFTAVFLVATQTYTKHAILCAVISFFSYNYFFTDPKYSFVMWHREDVLTATFFLLLSTITGQLTARLREKLNALNSRERISRIQFQLAEKLTASIEKAEILDAMTQALLAATCKDVFVTEVYDRKLEFIIAKRELDTATIEVIKTLEVVAGFTTVSDNTTGGVYYLFSFTVYKNKKIVVAMVFKDNLNNEEESIETSRLIIQQTNLALGRCQIAEELEKERINKEQELLRSALLSSVSHDLKTPLASMIGATTSLLELDNVIDSTQKKELLESILEESQRLDKYIQNLLDMTRLGHGELPLHRDWVAVEDILNVVIKRIKKIAPENKIDLHLEKAPLLSVHAALIEQALFNIIDNAIKYSDAGSVVEVIARPEKTGIIIEIADNGPGIPEEMSEKIFDKFYTMRRGDQHPAGTGLGLTITMGIISAHGGEVTVLNDQLHKTGTTMRVFIPYIGAPSSDITLKDSGA